jgi:hypothetical protein
MSLCQCSCASVKCRCSRVGAEDGWVLERLGEPLDCGGVQPAVWQRPAGGGRGTRPWIRPVGTATLSVRKASWKAVSGVAFAPWTYAYALLHCLPGPAPALSLSSVQVGPPEHALQLHPRRGRGPRSGYGRIHRELARGENKTRVDDRRYYKPKASPLLCWMGTACA